MAFEGKLSRAMAKLARDLSPAPAPVAGPPPVSPLERAAALPKAGAPLIAASFDRVTGRAGDMAPSAVLKTDPHGEVASQIRGIRGRILALNNGNPPRVIAVSSGSRAEGKTTTALNLGLAFSEIGAGRVLVIDGDVLCPNLGNRAGIEARRGLLDVLQDDLDLNGCVYESSAPNLDILPTRTVGDPKAVEALLHQSSAKLIAKLRRHYAFILIDTPPVLAGTQAATFGKAADGVLVVAQLEKTSRHVVKRAVEELVKAGATIIGCILTHQKHHVPNFIYRFFGATPSHYYRYGYRRLPGTAVSEGDEQPKGAAAPSAAAETSAPAAASAPADR